jgi:hypothetical protein
MRRVLIAAVTGLALALPAAACSSPAPPRPADAAAPVASSVPSSVASSLASSADPATSAEGLFTVAGNHPVPANGSQDTSVQAAGVSCDSVQLAVDKHVGAQIAAGFSVAGLPASADLLRHFLAGSGTVVSYPAGSRISELATASAAFAAVNKQVQAAVARQLKAGQTRVELSAAQLPLVSFDTAGGDLYWGFRGTQGLTLAGSGRRVGQAFTGTLRYVIRDSYGFPAGDTLGGFGPPMRYLQTACGAPQHPGGAHWFPDSIAVTVPFRQPA